MDLKSLPLIKRLLNVNCPFVAPWFPWFWRRGEMARLRTAAGRWTWRTTPGVKGRTVLVVKTLVWPFIAVAGIFASLLAHGPDGKRISGRGYLAQLRDLLYFTVWRGFPPQEYYYDRLYYDRLTEVMEDYLADKEIAILNMAVNSDKDSERVNNKLRLCQHCEELGLPSIPLHGVFSGGQERPGSNGKPLPKKDLYFKPVSGLRGAGIERWEVEGEDCWNSAGRQYDEHGLKTYFAEASFGETFILQEAAVNHPEVQPFSPGPLVTFRVMSVVGEEGIEIMGSYMVMPFSNTVANHGSYGGLVAEMDIRTGRLFPAFKRLPVLQQLEHHPQTGGRIAGEVIQQWPVLEALAKRAHGHFADIFTIGWDLALTPDGPAIVEGNTQWGSLMNFFPGRTAYRRYARFASWLQPAGG
jgi:hypothetical protein